MVTEELQLLTTLQLEVATALKGVLTQLVDLACSAPDPGRRRESKRFVRVFVSSSGDQQRPGTSYLKQQNQVYSLSSNGATRCDARPRQLCVARVPDDKEMVLYTSIMKSKV